jgi:hypothetical protein
MVPPDAPPKMLAWPDRSELLARMTLHTLHPGPGHKGCLALIDQPAAIVGELSAAEILTA